jgi:hypothetical protein
MARTRAGATKGAFVGRIVLLSPLTFTSPSAFSNIDLRMLALEPGGTLNQLARIETEKSHTGNLMRVNAGSLE